MRIWKLNPDSNPEPAAPAVPAAQTRRIPGRREGPVRNVLRIDASARVEGSHGRALATRLIDRLAAEGPIELVERDLGRGVPLLDGAMVGAFFTPEEDRTDAQRAALAPSDTLVEELEAADAVVLALPIYNFHAPAAFKAWIDLVTRAKRTFRYTEAGPEGLLADRPVYVIVTSGGTQLGGELDFLTGWLRHVLGFIGLRNVQVVAADRLMADTEERLAAAEAQIDRAISTPLAA